MTRHNRHHSTVPEKIRDVNNGGFSFVVQTVAEANHKISGKRWEICVNEFKIDIRLDQGIFGNKLWWPAVYVN